MSAGGVGRGKWWPRQSQPQSLDSQVEGHMASPGKVWAESGVGELLASRGAFRAVRQGEVEAGAQASEAEQQVEGGSAPLRG